MDLIIGLTFSVPSHRKSWKGKNFLTQDLEERKCFKNGIIISWMKALTCASYDYMKLMVAELQRQLKELEEARNENLADGNIPPIAPPRRVAPQKPPIPSKVTLEAAPLGTISDYHE